MQPTERPGFDGTTIGDAIAYIPKCWAALDEANGKLISIMDYVKGYKEKAQ